MAVVEQAIAVADYEVFFDFDNTITISDVLDDIIKRFSATDEWQAWEKEWQEGVIGSAECLRRQLAGVRVSEYALREYLSRVAIDPHIRELVALLKRHRVKPVIVSDSFSWIIKTILKTHGIQGFRVYAHAARFANDKFIPRFAHSSDTCRACAHCKKENLSRLNPHGKKIMYIGDGLSDTCAAESADLVFAKGILLQYFRTKNKPCIAFTHLGDVQRYLEEAGNGTYA